MEAVGWFVADGYTVARFVAQRGVAAIYLVGFLVAANQGRALLGAEGLLPVPDFVRASIRAQEKVPPQE